ncbi:ABC transporter substrate-binding protein [Epidermidibacterium keratini]|uniref:ABC transporter substrate-binding protein n=1 Tax=Epidermidibacterium keratini TaxID=1891644 RepID=A0A7L4YND3_9ACTN|nr:ABC transporter substrate-binding protein [Epidermidibacterium keratini]QHC00403.1 ABC transporter substrate-binding protein [Epidermidibacterium keratini]
MIRKTTTSAVAAALTTALVLTGCSTKAADSSGGGGGGGLKTDVGVTDDTISLGIQTDLSGAFKVGGLGATQANQMWVEEVNANGGICERQIEIDTQDNNYKPDNALPLYDQQKTKVLGLLQLLGSPVLAALKQKLASDNMLAATTSWASSNLDIESPLMIGETYDVEMINGLAWLKSEGKISDGDKIGHIYVDSEYGQNAALGVKYYAEQYNLDVSSEPIAATDSDMTAIVAKLKDAGVKAILLTTSPAATGSIAVQNVSQNLNVPLMGNGPTFAPSLLADQSLIEPLKQFWFVSSFAPMSADIPKAKELLATYQEKFTDKPQPSVFQGYTAGIVWGEILKQACDDGDLTRQGVMDARKKLTDVDTEGLTGTLDFSDPGAPTTREGFVLTVDPSTADGLTIVKDLSASDDAKKYKTPYQK